MNITDKDDDFWNLDDYIKPSKSAKSANNYASRVKSNNDAVEISISQSSEHNPPSNNESSLTYSKDSVITKFIPPKSDAVFAPKHVLLEYSPQNPFIKSVRVLADKPDSSVFVKDNLFMRERRALLDRKITESPFIPFYSYAPRYSQLTNPQLKWYLWWRENARSGNFIKTDQSYIMLYAYELAATEDGEDKQKALESLCLLLTNYSDRDIPPVFKMIIRDMICDFCLINRLTPPMHLLSDAGRQILYGSFLPELFVDLSQGNNDVIISSLSVYDYRRSKFFNEQTKEVFTQGIHGALRAVMNNADAFEAITSFTKGMYGCITAERHPFVRMTNIVNRHVRIEINYFEMSNMRSAITDIVRYSENKVREHLGIKNKINVMSVSPLAKSVIDKFFADNLPAQTVSDRRRRENKIAQTVANEYDKLYDVPKAEISPENAMLIERESWNTTKMLVEAFYDDAETNVDNYTTQMLKSAPIVTNNLTTVASPQTTDEISDTYSQFISKMGNLADFILLCLKKDATSQRKLAHSHNLGTDELADRINEVALDIVGDIILEDDGQAYTVIADYISLFDI
jgi:hypothetical protein